MGLWNEYRMIEKNKSVIIGRFLTIALAAIWFALSPAVGLFAAEQPARSFAEGRDGAGELKYINDLPVLVVSGTPAEIGRQKAALTAEALKQLADYPRRLLERSERKDRLEKTLRMCKALAEQLPEDYREEMRAAAEVSGMDRDLGLMANMLPDVYRGGFACSSLIVDAEHSTTGGPLFGRNLDFYTLGILEKYNLVTVHRPKGKKAFAAVGFPGMFGCLSGINEAGLALAVHEVFLTRDGADIFNPKGMPYTFAFRHVLEQCATVAEAEKLLRETPRSTILSLAICDKDNAIVLEMTPKTVASRRPIEGILACTNHFRTDELAVFAWCNRYPKLILSRNLERLDVAAVARKLHEVNMGRLTVETMVFEPAALRLHLAVGSCPSSALPLKTLDLRPLMKP